MCGIVGIAAQQSVESRAWLARAGDAIRHRGPDDSGEWWSPDGRVGLGHRRLAIIDLTAGGHQPMCDAASNAWIVFNGEIYNFVALRSELTAKGHAFSSQSDTEVILAAYREWGTDCLLHLNGMFAFALYDARRQRVFLARDRAGEKPLFYIRRNDHLRFASEPKALLLDRSASRRIDAEALDCYLAMGFVPGERCIWRGMNKLPPAHALLYDLQNGQSRVWRYWSLPELERDADEKVEALLVDELEVLLEDAVRRQLTADVPVGVLLSGGVDSSLVTAMAARTGRKVSTFTVRFPGFGDIDETGHARLIAQHFSTEHVELDAGTVDTSLLSTLARQFDEPIIDSSMIPTYLVSRLTRQHCTVVLGGDGGDELFGGYAHYSRLLWMQRKLDWLPRSMRLVAAKAAGGLLPLGYRGRNWLTGLETDLRHDVPLIASYFDKEMRSQLLRWQSVPASRAERVRASRLPRSDDLLQRATRMDFQNYLAEDILVKVDRASMLNSLEVRAPFLDHRVIEFAFGRVPSNLKATAFSSKVLLKRLTGRILPPDFDQHRKQGFSIPLASWLKSGAWHNFFRDVLLADDSLFDRGVTKRLLAGQASGRGNTERLFALVMFELWRREYHAYV